MHACMLVYVYVYMYMYTHICHDFSALCERLALSPFPVSAKETPIALEHVKA